MLFRKMLRKLGYIRVEVAKKKVKGYREQYQEALDENTLLQIEVELLADQVVELEAAKELLEKQLKAQQGRLALAENILKDVKLGAK